MSAVPEDEVLIKQGAEALAYISRLLPLPAPRCLRKHRPSKPYRHPVLDARLTKGRILAESRLLARLRRHHVSVPAVLYVDLQRGDLWMELIEGVSVRDYLFSLDSDSTRQSSDDRLAIMSHQEATAESPPGPNSGLRAVGVESVEPQETKVEARTQLSEHRDDAVRRVMLEIGRVIAGMHNAEVVHGDLTTSNLLLRSSSTPTQQEDDHVMHGRVVVIDLGLGSVSVAAEDAAVDLYVLERAFLSTHPNSATHFDAILEGYMTHAKKGKEVVKRLIEVRKRGRKRTMVG